MGSTSMVAVWQEMGTAKIPPRSFLGSAAAKHGEVIAGDFGEHIVAVLAGLKRIP